MNLELVMLLVVICAFGLFAFSRKYGHMGGVQMVEDNTEKSNEVPTDPGERAE